MNDCRSPRTFTFDTNCIYALEEGESSAPFIRLLVEAHHAGRIDVAIAAVSASEKQRDHTALTDFTIFQARLQRLGLGGLSLVLPLNYFSISFWDKSLWSDEASLAREKAIHAALFPNDPYSWVDFATRANADPNDFTSKAYWKWRNLLCDRQVFWAHENAGREVLVTSNWRDFKKLAGHPLFPHATIMAPEEASATL